jgi:hypothetical protein
MRFSRRRAEITQDAMPPGQSSERALPAQLRARLERVRREVAAWQKLLPQAEEPQPSAPLGGTVINLRKSLWEHILQVSAELGLAAPLRVRVVARLDEIGMVEVEGGSELVLGPVMLSTREGESRFLIARALFRHACGLDRLQTGGQALSSLEGLAERVRAYNEWMCHTAEPLANLLDGSGDSGIELDELQVALEELFWSTGDTVYASFCEVLANRCWCPRGEFEADTFAHRYSDIIDATYALLASGLSDLSLYRECESHGISALLPQMKARPALVLRMQNLWMSGSEEIQKNQF